MGKSKIILILLITLVAYSVPFDRYFKKYSDKYFGKKFDYLWFVAQAKQESRFDSLAVSPVGAKGVMQIMPGTWKDLTNNIFLVESPRHSIKYGIRYNRQMWDIFKAPRPEIDKISFMFASYNAGAGNVIKAQKQAIKDSLNDNLWQSIIITLPKITGHHSKETITYVRRIMNYYSEYNSRFLPTRSSATHGTISVMHNNTSHSIFIQIIIYLFTYFLYV